MNKYENSIAMPARTPNLAAMSADLNDMFQTLIWFEHNVSLYGCVASKDLSKAIGNIGEAAMILRQIMED